MNASESRRPTCLRKIIAFLKRKLFKEQSEMAAPVSQPATANRNNNEPPSFANYLDQSQSPLFSLLPAEIRGEIFAYALTDFEDTSNPYSKQTVYARPGYDAPRRTCTELLRTCKRIFNEAWFMPFAYAEHSLYLTHQGRAPRRYITTQKMQDYLKLLYASQGDKIMINHVRAFAQLWILEPGGSLQEVLEMQYFYPKTFTITLRYTDFWFWERNEPLHIGGQWVQKCRFPNTLTRLCIDFESLCDGRLHRQRGGGKVAVQKTRQYDPDRPLSLDDANNEVDGKLDVAGPALGPGRGPTERAGLLCRDRHLEALGRDRQGRPRVSGGTSCPSGLSAAPSFRATSTKGQCETKRDWGICRCEEQPQEEA